MFQEEVDFFITTQTSMRIAVEVKSSYGSTNSSDDLLKSGKFKYLIKFENRYPEWEPGSRVIVFPQLGPKRSQSQVCGRLLYFHFGFFEQI
jgi:hypothetical protein